MGTTMAPRYANLFMGAFESTVVESAQYKQDLECRFLADIFMIGTHRQVKLGEFINNLNSTQYQIKFTFEIYPHCLHFLNVTLTLIDNAISIQLYPSCHPYHSV